MIFITKILVTGCAGFIGSNLVEELLKRGFEVVGIDDLSTGSTDNIKGMNFEFFRGTINNTKILTKIMKNVDYVLHHAAIASVTRSIEDPKETNEANVQGTLNLLACARDSRIKRVVFASSSSIYGNDPKLPKIETMKPDPISPYALTKYIGEMYCKLFNDIYGLETISLRYFNIFGLKQNPDSEYSAVIPKFIKLMLSGKRPTIYGDGTQTRDFCHIENVVKANILAINASKKACGHAYNIASGENTNLKHLVGHINSVLSTGIKPEYEKERPGDVKHSRADISLARKILGYEPGVNFRKGLEKTIEWYKTCR